MLLCASSGSTSNVAPGLRRLEPCSPPVRADVFCFPFQQKSRCIKLVTDVGFRLMTIRDVVPMKSKPPLFSLYGVSLSFTGTATEEDPLVVTFKDGT